MAKRTVDYDLTDLVEGVDTTSLDKEFEERIQKTIDRLGENYDLDNLNANDLLSLRALAQALISLEDYEIKAYRMKKDVQKSYEYDTLQRIEQTISSLRSDIVKLQDSLGITKSKRSSDRATSFQDELESLKKKAREFYEQKMGIVICPKCGMWLASVWFKDFKDKNNRISVTCNRILDDGSVCGEKISLQAPELLKPNQKLPETLR